MRVALVVPTYQEADNIEPFLRAARAALPAAEIIVCDDGSPDGTAALAEGLAGELGDISVLNRGAKAGLGAAYRHGFRVAIDRGADVVLQMDVDFSHPHSMLPLMVSDIADGFDVSVGSRYVPGGGTPDWTLHRKLLSRWGNAYARFMLGLEMHDATSGLRAYRAAILERIEFDTTRANGYGFQIETAYRLGQQHAKVVEQPLVFVDRVRGTSKMSPAIMAENMALVTWWGFCRRLPRLTRLFRGTAIGRRLEARHRRSVRGA